jgi:hypothetical protein
LDVELQFCRLLPEPLSLMNNVQGKLTWKNYIRSIFVTVSRIQRLLHGHMPKLKGAHNY